MPVAIGREISLMSLLRSRLRRCASLCLSLLLVCATWGSAQPSRPQSNRPAAGQASAARSTPASTTVRPRLVLLIVVDQFREDYFNRFGDLFGQNGLRRLLNEGAWWVNTNFDHMPTETAPGHATLLTGAWPAETGIVGNTWYERESGKRVDNSEDTSVKILGGAGDERGASPRRLLASTLGDELRLHTAGRAKVIGISAKDRGAIMPAGRHANAAYWFSANTGRIISSTYYFNGLPAWVQQFNEAKPSDKFFGAKWERLLKDEREYVRRAGPDAAEWENTPTDKNITFPHTIDGGASAPNRQFYDDLTGSPYSNDLLVEFAKLAITNENLGADADTDVLSVSFSANDYVGHRFGPYSQEVMDITLRTDRQIGELLDFVDQRVGLRNTVVAFSSDHGVAPIPEHAARLNLPGARIDPNGIMTAVKNAVKARFAKPGEDKDTTADYVQEFTPKTGNVYLNWAALKRDRIDREEIERVAGEAALTVPGVARYFTRTQLEREAISPADPIARRALHGFNAQRSGDVVLIYQPFHLIVTYTADHSSPYSYDTHVPLLLMGAGVAAGRYTEAATPADLAPTLAVLLRVEMPSNAVGRVLTEALKPKP